MPRPRSVPPEFPHSRPASACAALAVLILPARLSVPVDWRAAVIVALGLAAALLAWRVVALERARTRIAGILAERERTLTNLAITRERLEALCALARMEKADENELTRFALNEAVRLTGSATGYLFFLDETGEACRRFWSANSPHGETAVRYLHLPERERAWRECLVSKAPSVINEYDPRGNAPTRQMAVPLLEDGRVKAVLGVGDRADPYDADDTRQLQLFLSGLAQVLRARRSAQAVREARDYAESLIQGANALIVGLDSEGRVTVFNAAAQKSTGYSYEELRGRPWWRVIRGGEEAASKITLYRDFMAGRAALPKRHESVVRAKDGALRRIAWQISLLTRGEEVSGLIAFGIDVTEHKAAQTELTRLYQAIQQTAEGVLVSDAAGRVLFANAAFERMSGLTRKELLRRDRSVLDLDASILAHQASIIRKGEGGEGVWRGSCAFTAAGRAPAELEFTITALHDPDRTQPGFVVVCRDVTEKRTLERQLQQAQKMEALGTLAGGVAHDFNNILASIMGFAELALADLPENAHARRCLDRVLKASARAKELIRQILSFSRRNELRPRPIRPEEPAAEALRLLEASLPTGVVLAEEFSAGDCVVAADPSQIHQIVMNLCTNGAQAMGEAGGKIAVRTARRTLSPEEAARGNLPAGEYFSLCVEDEGPGIPPEALGRIFDPFFTTKGPGEGTGLGLSVVHGIATALGGTAQAENRAEGGARFRVLLPIRDEPAETDSEKTEAAAPGREAVLVVDDEPDILELCRQILENAGYAVTADRDPEAALRDFAAGRIQADLVVTDQRMPRLTGLRLIAALRNLRPGLPVVLVSGFDADIPRGRLAELGGVLPLDKPFSAAELLRAAERALAEARGKTAPGGKNDD